jgi:hypothetical protein
MRKSQWDLEMRERGMREGSWLVGVGGRVSFNLEASGISGVRCLMLVRANSAKL